MSIRGNIPGIILLLAALVLLILASITVPVVHEFYFLKATLPGASISGVSFGRTTLRLGMWGVCADSGSVRECTKRSLGYDLDLSFLNLSDDGRIAQAVLRGLSKALILHPIAAGITFIALLFALSGHIIVDIIGTIAAWFAALITLIAFIIDCVLFITAKNRINDVDSGTATLGNAFWFVMVAFICQFLAGFVVCCGGRRRRNNAKYGNGNGYTGTAPPMTQRRRFWQRNTVV